MDEGTNDSPAVIGGRGLKPVRLSDRTESSQRFARRNWRGRIETKQLGGGDGWTNGFAAGIGGGGFETLSYYNPPLPAGEVWGV